MSEINFKRNSQNLLERGLTLQEVQDYSAVFCKTLGHAFDIALCGQLKQLPFLSFMAK